MLLRFLLAALSLHCTICVLTFLIAGGNAIPFFVGFTYLWFFEGLWHVPVLIAPAVAAFVCFVLTLVYTANRPRVFLLLAGLIPVVVFIGLSEVAAFGAMRLSFLTLEQGACMYGSKTFTASLIDLVKNIDFLFGDTIRLQNHAHVAFPDGRLMIWSYSELSFVDYQADYYTRQIISQKCFSF